MNIDSQGGNRAAAPCMSPSKVRLREGKLVPFMIFIRERREGRGWAGVWGRSLLVIADAPSKKALNITNHQQ